MPTDHYYVYADITGGQFAKCSFFYKKDGTEPVPDAKLFVPATSTSCIIEQTSNSPLLLIGASYKTIGHPPALNSSNFCAADDENAVTVTMPNNATVSKGVVLLFSNRGEVQDLYPSGDPQVTNETP